MLRNLYKTILLLLCFYFVSCSKTKNHKNAFGYEENGQTFIKLKDKLSYMAHDPISVFLNKKYWDSIIITIPSLRNGKIDGADIPAPKGYYKYSGDISINGDELHVNLLINNTDDKKIIPFEWNGKYVFRKLNSEN
jgi:hypothetical protein